MDDFLARFCAAVNALPIGVPWQPGVKITPLPEFDKAKSMRTYVEDAVAKGAKVVWMQLGLAEPESAAKAKEAGLQVVMDRCMKVEHARRQGL